MHIQQLFRIEAGRCGHQNSLISKMSTQENFPGDGIQGALPYYLSHFYPKDFDSAPENFHMLDLLNWFNAFPRPRSQKLPIFIERCQQGA